MIEKRPINKNDHIEITTDLYQNPETLKVTKVCGKWVWARNKKLRVMIDTVQNISYILWSARKDIKLSLIEIS